MRFERTEKYKKCFKKLPVNIQTKCVKQLRLLATGWRHPSVRAKKMQGKESVWEGRIDKFYRFTFTISGDAITLRTIGPHDEALN